MATAAAAAVNGEGDMENEAPAWLKSDKSVFSKPAKIVDNLQCLEEQRANSNDTAEDNASSPINDLDTSTLADLFTSWAKSLGCAICLNRVREPVALSCLHSFCKHCVEMLLITNKNGQDKDNKTSKLTCPTCRQVSLIKRKDGVNQLTRNWFIDDFYEKINKTLAFLEKRSMEGDFSGYPKGIIPCENHDQDDAPYGIVCMRCVNDVSIYLQMISNTAKFYHEGQTELIGFQHYLHQTSPGILNLMRKCSAMVKSEPKSLRLHLQVPIHMTTGAPKITKEDIAKKHAEFKEALKPREVDQEKGQEDPECIFSPRRRSQGASAGLLPSTKKKAQVKVKPSRDTNPIRASHPVANDDLPPRPSCPELRQRAREKRLHKRIRNIDGEGCSHTRSSAVGSSQRALDYGERERKLLQFIISNAEAILKSLPADCSIGDGTYLGLYEHMTEPVLMDEKDVLLTMNKWKTGRLANSLRQHIDMLRKLNRRNTSTEEASTSAQDIQTDSNVPGASADPEEGARPKTTSFWKKLRTKKPHADMMEEILTTGKSRSTSNEASKIYNCNDGLQDEDSLEVLENPAIQKATENRPVVEEMNPRVLRAMQASTHTTAEQGTSEKEHEESDKQHAAAKSTKGKDKMSKERQWLVRVMISDGQTQTVKPATNEEPIKDQECDQSRDTSQAMPTADHQEATTSTTSKTHPNLKQVGSQSPRRNRRFWERFWASQQKSAAVRIQQEKSGGHNPDHAELAGSLLHGKHTQDKLDGTSQDDMALIPFEDEAVRSKTPAIPAAPSNSLINNAESENNPIKRVTRSKPVETDSKDGGIEQTTRSWVKKVLDGFIKRK